MMMLLRRLLAGLARLLKWSFRTGLAFAIVGAAVAFGPRIVTDIVYSDDIFWEENAPSAPVAIVYGAGLRWDGGPSLVLRDRVETAAQLYWTGRVQYLLLSGDNSDASYNEPRAMRDYALSLGLPANVLVLDYAGRRTYDTCLRAKTIFGVDRALLVTQHYHLDRALLTCDVLGIEVQGVAADRNTYSERAFRFWWLREFPATTAAMWDLFIDPPDNVVLGEPEPIPVLAEQLAD